jgi:hypothetical protein
MPRKTTTVGNLALVGYEDIFNASTGNPSDERVEQIPLKDLFPRSSTHFK